MKAAILIIIMWGIDGHSVDSIRLDNLAACEAAAIQVESHPSLDRARIIAFCVDAE